MDSELPRNPGLVRGALGVSASDLGSEEFVKLAGRAENWWCGVQGLLSLKEAVSLLCGLVVLGDCEGKEMARPDVSAVSCRSIMGQFRGCSCPLIAGVSSCAKAAVLTDMPAIIAHQRGVGA